MKSVKTKNKLSQNIDKYLEQNYTQFHSPAHCGFLNPRDLSEVEGLDDLQEPTGVLKEYQEKTADLFSAAASFFLVNGASLGMQAACLALKLYLEEKQDSRPVLVARNIHKSVLSGIILAGLEISWLEPEWNDELGIYTRVKIPENTEEKYSALIITNPSYEGFYSKLRELSIPVIVDEAHGAHYHFSKRLPSTALESGTDLVVQSWHKTLGSLTQTGVLHLNKNSLIPEAYVKACIKLLQTTSPSYLLLESICKVIDRYQEDGQKIIDSTIDKADQIQKYRIPNDDPLRALISVPGLNGEELDEILFEKKISLEQVHGSSVLAFINPGNSQEDIDNLLRALDSIPETAGSNTSYPKPIISSKSFNPRKSFFKNQEIEIQAPCPPGIVQNCPGDRD